MNTVIKIFSSMAFAFLVATVISQLLILIFSSSIIPAKVVNIKHKPSTIDCEVYACREETTEDHKYSDIGLPTKREWMTSREWKGEHLSEIKGNHKEIKAKFKEWKKCHIIKFIEFMGRSAIEESKVFPDLKPSVIIAQAILESNFGLSRLAKEGRNYFGHKYRGKNDAFIEAMDDGLDKFTVFTSVWYSLRNHSKIMMGRYRKRIKGEPTVDTWLHSLCGGMDTKTSKEWRKNGGTVYATSCFTEVCYSKKLRKVIDAYNLERFDKPLNKN